MGMNFNKKMTSGQVIYGPFMITTDPAFVESAGYAGFDFVVVDLEHGPASLDQLQNLIRAAEIADIHPIVRTPPGNLPMIGAVQDLGAKGVMVPQVKDAKEASDVVNAARFYPKGQRGVNGAVRAANYSTIESQTYFKKANENLLIIQLEGTEAIENIDEILLVEDIDVFFIGPYDLSQSLGVPGEINHPSVTQIMERVVNKTKARGLTLGTYVSSPEEARRWEKAGIQLLAYSMDVIIFVEASRNIINQLQEEHIN
jgi:4-hydroxy-2-oxoheptanedioate aldolase